VTRKYWVVHKKRPSLSTSLTNINNMFQLSQFGRSFSPTTLIHHHPIVIINHHNDTIRIYHKFPSCFQAAAAAGEKTDIFDSIFKEVEAAEAANKPETEELKKIIGRTEATAHKANIRSSMLKLREVTKQVQGLYVKEALRQLQVNNRKVAEYILKTIKMARNNARNLGIPTENLVVATIIIEKQKPIKRIKFRGKGGIGHGQGRECGIRVVVRPEELMVGKKWEAKKMRKKIKEKFELWKMEAKKPRIRTAEE